MSYDYDEYYEEDTMGMHITSGSVTLKKDNNNVIGISIGGGAPYCPCLYIVQVFDKSPAALNSNLLPGDEILAINSYKVKGWNKAEVARIIQMIESDVIIYYNKLHTDVKEGKTFDIVLKNFKHRVVENISSKTADALGLSRAILCNDNLVKKMNQMEDVANQYQGLVWHTDRYLKSFYAVAVSHKQFGTILSEIGNRELQTAARNSFSKFGDVHIEMSKMAAKCFKKARKMVSDLKTYINKAIPDTKLTVKKYLDVKFEYLSYCLKIKELDDESANFNAIREPLYRVETGNYEYRLVLRCRYASRKLFSQHRSDVMVKLELLDQKHVQDTAAQLLKFVSSMVEYYEKSLTSLEGHKLFPLEIDIERCSFGNLKDKNEKGEHLQPSGENSNIIDSDGSCESLEPFSNLIGEEYAPKEKVKDLIDTS